VPRAVFRLYAERCPLVPIVGFRKVRYSLAIVVIIAVHILDSLYTRPHIYQKEKLGLSRVRKPFDYFIAFFAFVVFFYNASMNTVSSSPDGEKIFQISAKQSEALPRGSIEHINKDMFIIKGADRFTRNPYGKCISPATAIVKKLP